MDYRSERIDDSPNLSSAPPSGLTNIADSLGLNERSQIVASDLRELDKPPGLSDSFTGSDRSTNSFLNLEYSFSQLKVAESKGTTQSTNQFSDDFTTRSFAYKNSPARISPATSDITSVGSKSLSYLPDNIHNGPRGDSPHNDWMHRPDSTASQLSSVASSRASPYVDARNESPYQEWSSRTGSRRASPYEHLAESSCPNSVASVMTAYGADSPSLRQQQQQQVPSTTRLDMRDMGHSLDRGHVLSSQGSILRPPEQSRGTTPQGGNGSLDDTSLFMAGPQHSQHSDGYRSSPLSYEGHMKATEKLEDYVDPRSNLTREPIGSNPNGSQNVLSEDVHSYGEYRGRAQISPQHDAAYISQSLLGPGQVSVTARRDIPSTVRHDTGLITGHLRLSPVHDYGYPDQDRTHGNGYGGAGIDMATRGVGFGVGGGPKINNRPGPACGTAPVSAVSSFDGFVYKVQFKRSQRNFLRSEKVSERISPGDFVMVEADRGEDLGVVYEVQPLQTFFREGGSLYNKEKGVGMGDKQSGVKHILRHAQAHEYSLLPVKMAEEQSIVEVCRERALGMYGLPMTVVDVEYQFDRHKLSIIYESSRRIDFRELVRDMFGMYKARIWMEHVNYEFIPHDGAARAFASGSPQAFLTGTQGPSTREIPFHAGLSHLPPRPHPAHGPHGAPEYGAPTRHGNYPAALPLSDDRHPQVYLHPPSVQYDGYYGNPPLPQSQLQLHHYAPEPARLQVVPLPLGTYAPGYGGATHGAQPTYTGFDPGYPRGDDYSGGGYGGRAAYPPPHIDYSAPYSQGAHGAAASTYGDPAGSFVGVSGQAGIGSRHPAAGGYEGGGGPGFNPQRGRNGYH